MADKMCKEKEYTFVQETIRPKKKSKIRKVAVTILMGAIFGVVSCIVFCLCLPLFSDYFTINSKQIIIGKGDELQNAPSVSMTPTVLSQAASPTADPTMVPTKEPKKTTNPGEKDAVTGLTVSSDKVEAICDKVNRCIVTVNSMKDSYDMFSGGSADTGATSGIVVGKSERNLLIYVNIGRIDESQNIFVTFTNNTMVAATVFSKHEELGIAILAVELTKLSSDDLATVDIAEFDLSDELKTGETVLAMGNPNGHLYSFACGYISNSSYNAYIVDNSVTLINTTITCNTKGDGVLVNTSGKIIGFITHEAGFASDLNYDVNTCYSIATLKPIITQLVNKTTEIYFGVTASDITSEIAYKTSVGTGIYITGVENNSPAFYADLKKGDIITEVEGEIVTSPIQFHTVINQYKEKEKVIVTFLRNVNGKQVKKKIAVELSIVK